MKKKFRLYAIWLPVIIVAFQVLVNLLYLLPDTRPLYYKAAFYLNLFFGTNILYSFGLVAMAFGFSLCSWTKWAAIAELLFAINYTVVQSDNLYNILFQVIVGTIALIATFRSFVKKFPSCRFSLLAAFLVGTITHWGNFKKGYEILERNLNRTIHDHV